MGDITCILCTHNRSAWLCEAISSIIHQTYKDWNLIVVRNRCSDWSEFAVDTFMDSRIRQYQNDGMSRAAAFNWVREEKLVKTKYVTFFDDDDIMFPSRFIDNIKMMEETGADIGYSSRWAVLPTEEMIYIQADPFDINAYLKNPGIGVGSMIMKTELFQKVPFDEEYVAADDYEWLPRVMKTNPVVAWTKIPSFIYRKHMASMSEKQYGRAKDYLFNKAKAKSMKWANKVKPTVVEW